MTEAVVNVSPSQITTFRQCKRRWAWGAIAKIREPQKASAGLGEKVHKHLEAWLEHATMPPSNEDAGCIAISMIQHCPVPKTVLVERWISIKRPHYTIKARGDVLGPALVPPLVQDHKTSSDIAAYANTEEDLLTDPQAIIYAAALFIMLAEHGLPLVDVEIRFVYGATRGKRFSKKVSVLFSHEYVEHMMATNIDVTAHDIVRTKRTCTNPLELEPTISACGDFGGCYFRSGPVGRACNISPQEFLMSSMPSIASLFATAPTPINAPPAAPPPPPTPDAPLLGGPPQSPTPLGEALAAAPPPPPPVSILDFLKAGPPAPPKTFAGTLAASPAPELLGAPSLPPPALPQAPAAPPPPPAPSGGSFASMLAAQQAPAPQAPQIPGPPLESRPLDPAMLMLLDLRHDKVQLACALIRAGHPADTVARVAENILRDLGGRS